MPQTTVRIGDREREEVLDQLREHLAAGRLTVSEAEERTAAALAARTAEDLAPLLADLPRVRSQAERRRRAAARKAEVREHVRTYVAVIALLWAIWLLTGAGYAWPVWPTLGWGLGLLAHAAPGAGCHAARAPRVPGTPG